MAIFASSNGSMFGIAEVFDLINHHVAEVRPSEIMIDV